MGWYGFQQTALPNTPVEIEKLPVIAFIGALQRCLTLQ